MTEYMNMRGNRYMAIPPHTKQMRSLKRIRQTLSDEFHERINSDGVIKHD